MKADNCLIYTKAQKQTYLNKTEPISKYKAVSKKFLSPLNSALVTVVITSYNPGPYLREAVDSVFKQTYKNWEMIIVDDGSTDNSLKSIRKYMEDPRIRLLHNHKNLGQTNSLNLALQHVQTPFMVQLDADDWFLPNSLNVLAREAGRCTADVALISGNIKRVWLDKQGRQIKSVVWKGQHYKDKYDFLLANRSCWPRFYRTSALWSVGGWPTGGPYEGRYIEDLRILLKLIPYYRFRWIDQTLYLHRRHNHNMTRQTKEMKETLFWLINDTLKSWGNQYRPKYRYSKNGYPRLVALLPL